MPRTISDAIIIGAGAAGLVAARELSRKGLHITIVEARDRIGGRIHTLHDSSSPLPVELGAEFVHGEPEETLAIVRAARLNLDRLPDGHFRSRKSKLSLIPDYWATLREVRQDITKLMSRARPDISLTEYLERKMLAPESRQLLLNYAQGYDAAEPDKISIRSLAWEEEEDNKQFRVTAGYDQVINWLRAGLEPASTEIRLNTVAIEIRWKRGEVVLQCKSRTGAALEPFRSRAAVITVPAALLRAKSPRFVPDLPDKEHALEKLEPGHVFKAVLRFREAFWQSDRFLTKHRLDSNRSALALNFIHAEEEDVPVWWTAQPSQAPLLTAWAGGPKAESLLSDNEESRINKTVAALPRVFGVSRHSIDELLESWSTHDWRSDPFSRQAYTYVGVGGLSAAKSLAKSVEATLFFAGEATDMEEMGTVAGALRSGLLAARQISKPQR
jgi:monoamine oxidase